MWGCRRSTRELYTEVSVKVQPLVSQVNIVSQSQSPFFSFPSPVCSPTGSFPGGDMTSLLSFAAKARVSSPWVSLVTGHWRRGQFFRDLAVSIQGFTQAKQKLYLPPKTLYDSGFWSSSQKLIPTPGFFLEPQVCWLNLPILSFFAQCLLLCLCFCYCFYFPLLVNRSSNGKNLMSQAKIICIHDKEKRLIFSNLLESGSLFFMFQKSVERTAY